MVAISRPRFNALQKRIYATGLLKKNLLTDVAEVRGFYAPREGFSFLRKSGAVLQLVQNPFMQVFVVGKTINLSS